MTYPNYYTKFKCSAERCRHNCCIGWEIDIDADTLELYRALDSSVSQKIEDGHFVLTEGGRCPFLNEQNLCTLITRYGDGALCDICAEHPRFYNYIGGREEVGLGLCCEEAAKIIINQPELFEVYGDEDEDFCNFRRYLIRGVQTGSVTPEDVLLYCGAKKPEKSLSEWADVFLSLERMDDAWQARLLSLKDRRHFTRAPRSLKRILAYFIYRHLQPDRLADTAAFCYLCYIIIKELSLRTKGGDEIIEVARQFSCEIEYSDENKERLIATLSE